MTSEPRLHNQGALNTRTVKDLVNTLRTQESRKLADSKLQTITEFVKVNVSLFEGLSLSEYIVAKKARCKEIHNNLALCSKCYSLIDAATIILNENPVTLPCLWNRCFNNIPYNSGKAKRKILQMPVSALSVNNAIYVTEKKETLEEYALLANKIQSDFITSKNKSYIPPKDYEVLLSVAQGEVEKTLLKHTVCSTQNLSRRQASQIYGISKLKERADTVNKTAITMKEIKDRHSALAKSEQKQFLLSCGENIDDYLMSSSDSFVETDSESSSDGSDMEESTSLKIKNNNPVPVVDFTERSVTDKLIGESNIQTAAKILKEVSFNWFAFVVLLQSKFRSQDESVVDSLMIEIASLLPKLGFSEEEVQLIEQSRVAYLETIEQNEKIVETISLSSTDSSSEESEEETLERLNHQELINSKLRKIKDNARKRMLKEIEAKRFLRKRISKSTKTILDKYSDIGEVIENIVQESDVGADRWRRTGVYTFSGDIKSSQRITYGKIQQRLEEHYGRHFSYGTVVQLCVPRHKRHRSSKRYSGVANVKYMRARKGFTLKFNPDCKWSRSMYKSLNELQKDGRHMLLVNRDDQAGFRLDSTFTHKNYPVLSVKPTLTTRTDFLNKYQAQLQVTSYNFSKTSNTVEQCVGVVKASGIHEKSPAQHSADLSVIENMDVMASAFLNTNKKAKEFECIRVDGTTDKGPCHAEVQFMWCERHVSRKTKVTLVTTRCSGDSYLNRVELQNGCLSRGHSNTFIPSTLHGSPYSDNGEFDKEKHEKNMSAALDQYISRVDGTPCMKTVIHLTRGAENHDFVSRRNSLLVFLKGNKKEKLRLKNENPTLFNYFSEIWDVRNNHMDKSLPEKYIFMLRCCGKSGCPHPLCQEGKI